MRQNDEERCIARLLKECERLSARHSETMARISSNASSELRDMHLKRARILKERIRMLKAELGRLRRLSSRKTTKHKKPIGSELAH